VGELYAFAAGCASGGRTCTPLWTARARNQAWASSPAVANGVVYFTGQSGKSRYANLNAYDAGCASGGETCTPLWTAFPGVGASSPTVANGVVYVTADHEIYAYAVGCATGGKICDPLWTATTGGGSDSSPVIANGAVYVASLNGGLYAFSLDGATPPATSTATSQPLTEPGAPNGILALGLVAFLAGTMLTLSRQQRHTD
jgi:outer membrane protein assembly factor BamB